MFDKVLIANRGEIACRVIKTARKLGVLTVAVYSDADQDALHVNMADEAIYLGASPARDSYLDIDKIINAAKQSGAKAVHPGYGFLSENADFCRRCAAENIVFIGPPTDAIVAMGSKSAAKQIMEKAGVPLVPGYHGDDQNPEIIRQSANDMGYPVLLKATAGGGGKGMRQVWSADEFDAALEAAKREALNGFGDDTMLVEKYLTQPRHIEIQVFCDSHGNAVYLFERDCSIQRRHQKVIEEAPAPGLSESLRQEMGEAAVRAAQAINYVGAGTVEFLLDSDGSFYFMEMNTRLQVEHPVTEMITGLDLVDWQLRVATGGRLPLAQHELHIRGHAIEARIYAEDPDNEFLPQTGTLHFLETPTESAHVRVDTGVRQGDEVSVYYDPMIAKLIVWDDDRNAALRRLESALSQYRIDGVINNIDFLRTISRHPAFIAADFDTGFIGKNEDSLISIAHQAATTALPLAALYLAITQQQAIQSRATASNDNNSPWNTAVNWRLNQVAAYELAIKLNGDTHIVSISAQENSPRSTFSLAYQDQHFTVSGSLKDRQLTATIDGHRLSVTVSSHNGAYCMFGAGPTAHFSVEQPDLGDNNQNHDLNQLVAPMNGTVVSHLVDPESAVTEGTPLMIMEAMKMEHTIRAPADGIVNAFYFQAGELVSGGDELIQFEVSQ
ncbi:Acetyl-/propionyl-coenzyme A carboxylase alpha chain [Zhongshania aliphaticivorans]|uniref:Biotin carboxylase n=1 Tax=Zhongshania aliphaticivorans TaxID=1470434 RepID=A0A5S9Q2R7_9GAMM|nr:acetyl/propionyl/methylcrotonyl-CoA carboxylase subunit alpha [Zhongshania aliphaticivorans]CAA0093842.1 Acetyl-/propionyl-coenzyme A carboxylase alpha chain [Zhongshania aliphaticivorans]CAA0111908.1 Acetyl-/propionyl-coenzyme A carboxylase alpha chain [Zhongshania aliphaticivorans]